MKDLSDLVKQVEIVKKRHKIKKEDSPVFMSTEYINCPDKISRGDFLYIYKNTGVILFKVNK